MAAAAHRRAIDGERQYLTLRQTLRTVPMTWLSRELKSCSRPESVETTGYIRGAYASSDRRPTNCFNPQLRASSDATAHVGV